MCRDKLKMYKSRTKANKKVKKKQKKQAKLHWTTGFSVFQGFIQMSVSIMSHNS